VDDGSFADPQIIAVGNDYYAFATNGPLGNVQTLTSRDLVSWETVGDALPSLPEWTAPGRVWAPEVAVHAPDRYVMYYTSRDVAADRQAVGVAVASTPTGPYVDKSMKPLISQDAEGGSIDASPFQDSTGRRWLYWKNDGNAIGVDTTIWVQPLDHDGITLLGKPRDTGLRQTQPWQGALVEAPAVIRHGETYVMFYSANDYGSAEYAMGYAVASSPQGPFVDQSPEPWVSSTPEAAGPGGQAVVTLGDETWLAYHAWDPDKVGYAAGGERSMWLDRIRWDGDVPVLEGPSTTPQAVPSG
jgi:beta-xylosidase